jgi:hypothetical protein
LIINFDINKKGEILLGFCVDNIEYSDDSSQMSLGKKTLYFDDIRVIIKGRRKEYSFLSLSLKKEKIKGEKLLC